MTERLKHTKDPVTQRPHLPDDMSEKFLKVSMTASNKEFMKEFNFIKLQASANSPAGVNPKHPSVEELTKKANSPHRQLCDKGNWHADETPGTSVFTAGSGTASSGDTSGHGGCGRGQGRGRGGGRGGGRSKKKCWNCGSEEHGEPECPQPKDPACIAANKKAFCDAKKKAAKWAPPTLDEESTGNKRLIGGEPMQHDTTTSCWNPVEGGSLVTPPGPALLHHLLPQGWPALTQLDPEHPLLDNMPLVPLLLLVAHKEEELKLNATRSGMQACERFRPL